MLKILSHLGNTNQKEYNQIYFILTRMATIKKKKRKKQRISITSVEKIWTNWNPDTFLIGM